MMFSVQYALRRVRPRATPRHYSHHPHIVLPQSRPITLQPDENARKYAAARKYLQEEDFKRIQDLRHKANVFTTAIEDTEPEIRALQHPGPLRHRQDRNPQQLLQRLLSHFDKIKPRLEHVRKHLDDLELAPYLDKRREKEEFAEEVAARTVEQRQRELVELEYERSDSKARAERSLSGLLELAKLKGCEVGAGGENVEAKVRKGERSLRFMRDSGVRGDGTVDLKGFKDAYMGEDVEEEDGTKVGPLFDSADGDDVARGRVRNSKDIRVDESVGRDDSDAVENDQVDSSEAWRRSTRIRRKLKSMRKAGWKDVPDTRGSFTPEEINNANLLELEATIRDATEVFERTVPRSPTAPMKSLRSLKRLLRWENSRITARNLYAAALVRSWTRQPNGEPLEDLEREELRQKRKADVARMRSNVPHQHFHNFLDYMRTVHGVSVDAETGKLAFHKESLKTAERSNGAAVPSVEAGQQKPDVSSFSPEGDGNTAVADAPEFEQKQTAPRPPPQAPKAKVPSPWAGLEQLLDEQMKRDTQGKG